MTTNTSAEVAPDSVCHIESIQDDDGKAACLLRWGPVTSVLTTDLVLSTARELMAAAVHAETDIALLNAFRGDFNIGDNRMLSVVLAAVRGARKTETGRCALRIAAVAGANTGRPYVRIGRGSMSGDLSPDEARGMAVQWVETATASRIDLRLRYALGEWDRLTVVEVDELFGLLRQVQR